MLSNTNDSLFTAYCLTTQWPVSEPMLKKKKKKGKLVSNQFIHSYSLQILSKLSLI